MSEKLRKLKDKAANYLARGKLEKALDCYQKALTLAPRDVYLRQKIAEIYARLGLADAAVREFQHIAGHYAAKGFFLRAIGICKVILSLDPSHTETQATLAELTSRQQPERETPPPSFQMPSSMSGVICAEAAPDVDEPEAEVSVLSAMDEIEIELDREWTGASRAEDQLRVLDEFELDVEEEDEADEEEKEDEDVTVHWSSQRKAAAPDGLEEEDPTVKASMAHILACTGAAAEAEPSAILDPATLPRVPLFAGLPRAACIALIERVVMLRTAAGEQVLTEGEVGQAMYAVVEGTFDVIDVEPTGHQRVTARLGAGSFFGEMALLAHCPRLASVVCVESGVLLELDRETFEVLCRDHPAVRSGVEEYFFSRLLTNTERISRIFGSFSEAARWSVVRNCQVATVEAGTVVVEQDGIDGGVFLVLRGQCEVTRQRDDGTSTWLAMLREGEVFGEISTMLKTRCTATVRALVDTVLLHIPPTAFREIFTIHDEVLFTMDDLIEQRLEEAGLTVAELL